MKVLLDTQNGVQNKAFQFYIKNYNLSFVAIDEWGEIHTVSEYDIPECNWESLDKIALNESK